MFLPDVCNLSLFIVVLTIHHVLSLLQEREERTEEEERMKMKLKRENWYSKRMVKVFKISSTPSTDEPPVSLRPGRIARGLGYSQTP